MKHLLQVSVVIVLAALVGACASTGSEHAGVRANPNTITQAEVEASTATNVYDLIQSLRPSWLRVRGAASQHADPLGGGDVMVYLNQSRIGTTAELRNMSIDGITSLQFLDAAAATQRWGTGHAHGAIVVSTSPRTR